MESFDPCSMQILIPCSPMLRCLYHDIDRDAGEQNAAGRKEALLHQRGRHHPAILWYELRCRHCCSGRVKLHVGEPSARPVAEEL